MHPDTHLVAERYRARELRAAAARHGAGPRLAAGSAPRRLRAVVGRRIGWALVETGLWVVHFSGRAPRRGAHAP